MNKVIKTILNIIFKILCSIIILLLLLYFGLWIFVNNSIPKEVKQKYNNSSVLNISDEQYQIIWFVWEKNKNNKFKWYPFIIDGFFRSYADSYASYLLLYDNDKYNEKLKRSPNRLPVWHMEYGLKRYIRKKNDYKKCLSIILSKSSMGNGIYGIENASKYYYNKIIEDLTEKELISLVLLSLSSTRYKIGGENSENKTNEIIYKYNN
jgi:hypothetical protein